MDLMIQKRSRISAAGQQADNVFFYIEKKEKERSKRRREKRAGDASTSAAGTRGVEVSVHAFQASGPGSFPSGCTQEEAYPFALFY